MPRGAGRRDTGAGAASARPLRGGSQLAPLGPCHSGPPADPARKLGRRAAGMGSRLTGPFLQVECRPRGQRLRATVRRPDKRLDRQPHGRHERASESSLSVAVAPWTGDLPPQTQRRATLPGPPRLHRSSGGCLLSRGSWWPTGHGPEGGAWPPAPPVTPLCPPASPGRLQVPIHYEAGLPPKLGRGSEGLAGGRVPWPGCRWGLGCPRLCAPHLFQLEDRLGSAGTWWVEKSQPGTPGLGPWRKGPWRGGSCGAAPDSLPPAPGPQTAPQPCVPSPWPSLGPQASSRAPAPSLGPEP